MYNTNAKIAIVYDWIDKWGGVERVLLHLYSLFPQAHFFTSAVVKKNAQWAAHLPVHSSFLQKLPATIRSNRALMSSLYPIAFESFRFDEYKLVISVTSAFAKGIITKPGTTHVCYLLTPPRYLWSHTTDYISGALGVIGTPFFSHLKKWDIVASARPDAYISISNTTAERANRYYGVASPVVHPPFDTQYWDQKKKNMKRPVSLTASKPYYLWVGRMETYKKPDLIVEVAKILPDETFIFVGTGALAQQLKNKSPHNCHFLGLVPDEELSYLYTHSKALLMPQNEDFGYVALEAQYHCRPVIAYGAGGARETIQEGITGLFFEKQTPASLVSQLERFEQISYNLIHSTEQMQEKIKERFGVQRFDKQFLYQLNNVVSL